MFEAPDLGVPEAAMVLAPRKDVLLSLLSSAAVVCD